MSGVFGDAKLALYNCRESKKEVVTDSVGNQRPLLWALSGLLVGLSFGLRLQNRVDLRTLTTMMRTRRMTHVRLPPVRYFDDDVDHEYI